MSDREKWILGVIGSIVTLGIGYLIWKHESAVTAAQNAQLTSQIASNDAQYAQQLEQALQVGGGVSQSSLGGGGYIGSSISSSTPGATVDSTGGVGGDSTLAAILAAFYPNGTSTATNNGSGSGGTDTTQQPPTLPAYNHPVANPVHVAPIDINVPVSTIPTGTDQALNAPIVSNRPTANPVSVNPKISSYLVN